MENIKEKMPIDYYCYMTDEFETMVKLGLFDENERTKYMEKVMGIFCVNGYFFQNWHQRDILQADIKEQLAIYDPVNNDFYNLKDKKIDIADKTILPKTSIQLTKYLIDKISEFGGISLSSLDDCKTISRWFEHISIGRDIKNLTYGEFNDNMEKYVAEFGIDNRVFFKTVQKGISDVCKMVHLPFGDGKPQPILFDSTMHQHKFWSLKKDHEILITKPVTIRKDEHGKREWRVFVINDEMVSISRFNDYNIEVEPYVQDYANLKIGQIKGNLPSTYCVDIFEFTDEQGILKIGICELNEIIASGLFYNNFVVPPADAKVKKLVPSKIEYC